MSEKILLNTTHFLLLRKLREQLELSVESVSKAINKSSAWVGQVERGRFVSVKKPTLIALLKVLYRNADTFDDDSLLERFMDDAVKEAYSSLGDKFAVELTDQIIMCVSDSIKLLLEMLKHNKAESEGLQAKYNGRVITINATCERLNLPYRLKELEASNISDICLVTVHLRELTKTLESVIVLKKQLVAEEDQLIVSNLEMQSDSEWVYARHEGRDADEWSYPEE